MKKYLFFLIGLMMISSVMAISTPHPVYGEITNEGYAVQGLEIKVANLVTGKTSTVTTNVKGFYQTDLGNVDPSYRDGDTVKVSLVHCEQFTRCAKTIQVSGGGNEVTFDVATEDLPDDSVIVTHIETCWDGSQIINGNGVCSEQPAKIECADGTIVEDASECPETSNSWLTWVLGIILVFFSGAGFWRIGGKYGFMHLHRGIKSYHNPNTQHKNTKYRHVAFWKNPVLAVKQIKAIEKGELPPKE